jgi:hypothetical protein
MKHRKSLLASIWIIAIGIILWISGPIIRDTGIIYHGYWYELTWVYYLGVGIVWSGVSIFILGTFGIITTFIREYLDKERKSP